MNAEGGLQFVDTNVLIYAYDRSAGDRHQSAARLVGEFGAARRGATSVQVLQEFYVNVTRKIAEPLDHDTAVRRLEALSRWAVHTPSAADVVAASGLSRSSMLSFWDAMIVHSAGALGCAVLWSEDLSDGQRIGSVIVRNPFRT